jgi:hypothetical protein
MKNFIKYFPVKSYRGREANNWVKRIIAIHILCKLLIIFNYDEKYFRILLSLVFRTK